MVLESIVSILVDLVKDPIREYILSPITRQVSYAFKCDHRVQTLQDDAVQLKNKKDRLQQSADLAARNGEEIYPNITEWLSSADRAIEEAEALVQCNEEAKKKCFVGLCPNFKTRFQISKKAVKRASEIHKLQNEDGLDSVSFLPPLQQIAEPSVYNRESLTSRVSLLNRIMDALRDSNLNMIGVYGMGGIGKTTLAKEVQTKAREEKLFETAVLVAVSQTPELRRIQGEIADFLGLKFHAEEIPGRASQLRRRLENSKVLIILDDLWQDLDLDRVGIPSRGASKNCKIMLTSRNMRLLSMMGSQVLLSLEALDEVEALKMFKAIAEPVAPNLDSIATKIAAKCSGLPLLIQIVATQLKDKESHVWNDTLNQLSTFEDETMYEKVYKVLESSYHKLPTNEMKSFFLLCALFGQSNIRIQYLLTYSMGLNLFKHIRTVQGARDRVFTLIDELKANSLLLDGDMAGFVKMHDVVRDTALNIASKVWHAFIGSSGVTLRDWPNEECKRISLPFCQVDELPLGTDCPEAELFLLFTEDLGLQVPDSFFNGMKKLRVVDFTGLRMVPLPSSVGLLTKLQTLCLHKCRLDDVAVLGELKQLELLSFAGSHFVELPREIQELTRLKLLDLRDCSNLQVFPASTLSKLCSLEELYLLNSFVRWGSQGNASLMELESLLHLVTLEIEIMDPKMIPRGVKCFSRLRMYKVSIGNVWDWEGQYEKTKTLKLKVEIGVDLENGTQLLLRESEALYLDGVWGIQRLFYEGFPKAKHMQVQNDFDIPYLIDSTMGASSNAFPFLESLQLYELHNLETICCGQLRMGSFGELQILTIRNCDKLRSLFSLSSAKCLQNLRELGINSCRNMEVVFGEDEHHNNEVIELTQLRTLFLSKLPCLVGFCKTKGGAPQTGLLFNTMVSFPNLTSLEVDECNSLNSIFTSSMQKCLMQLQILEITRCVSVEEIIERKKTEEIVDEDCTETILFPKLDSLLLDGLQNAKSFGSCHSIEFLLLRELTIEGCYAFRNFIGRGSASESNEEHLFNEKVTFSNLEMLKLDSMNSFKYIWDEPFISKDSFFKLKTLEVVRCPNLAYVFSANIYPRFARLENLCLILCDGVEQIYQQIDCQRIENAFSLTQLKVDRLPSLKHIWNIDKCGAFIFQNLESVEVDSCKNLRYVFPASIASGLHQLQCLQVRESNLEGVIAEKYDHGVNASFQFPKLTELELTCSTMPDCSNIYAQKFLSTLEKLAINVQGFHAIQRSPGFSVELCSKLKEVSVRFIDEDTSLDKILGFLIGLKSLEAILFYSCSLEEIFRLDSFYQGLIGDEQHHGPRVQHLELQFVEKLKHITKKDSQFNHILQHLQSLLLDDCGDLITIAPFTTSLQNLTTLHVFRCRNMTSLVNASTAKTMVHLTEMKVKYCERIEEIVAGDGDDMENGVIIIFNQLQRLELTRLATLNSFCSTKNTFSFPLLEQVTISECPRMETFCGGAVCTQKLRGILVEEEHQWEGNLNATITSQLRKWVGEHLEDGRLYKNLESLQLVNNMLSSKAILSANQMQFLNKLRKITVRDCDSIRAVFDLEELSAEEGYIGLLPKLKKLKLISLPMLTQLCNRIPRGILDFKKLKVLCIDSCDALKYVLTWSMSSCLPQLKRVEVKNCEMMETLIIDEENGAALATFNKLESVVLESMPQFSCIYSGSGVLQCLSLKTVTMEECPSIKALFISTHGDSANQVFPKLEKLSTDMNSIKGMMQVEAKAYLLSDLKTLKLTHCSATTKLHVSLVRFLSRLPNLEKFKFCDSCFKVLHNNNIEEATAMHHIKSLTLENVCDMNQIWWRTSLYHSKLVSSTASFQSLESLNLRQCNQLMNLITPSIAGNMLQLKVLKVSYCKMLTEIVGNADDQTTKEVVFTNLKTIKLVDLKSLEAFSLTHHNFKFPCLDKVLLQQCPNLRIFCPGIIDTPMLNCVEEGKYCPDNYWEGDLNTTIKHLFEKMVGFEYAREIKLSKFTVREKWEMPQLPFSLSFLERLEMDRCTLFSKVIPCHQLQHLERLKVLIVEKCDSVEKVIDFEGLNAQEYMINRMRNLIELKLIDLPRLKQVWSKDPQEISSFQNLQILSVHNCSSLTSVFSLSMALSLPNLRRVEVKGCSLLKHIIMVKEEEKMQNYQTIFPSLHSMCLVHLTNLLSFCSENGVLECPSLNMIAVVDCPNMKLFASKLSEQENSSITVDIANLNSVTALLGNKIVIPRLEGLKFEWKNLKGEYESNQSELFTRMKHIALSGLSQCDEKYATFAPKFLGQFHKLESLCLEDAALEKINLDQLCIPEDNDLQSVASLKHLKLSKLPNLRDFNSVLLSQNLVALEVVECSSLKTLALPLVSLHNLRDLRVFGCDGLKNLISAPTSCSLVQLRFMIVKNCKMMEEIVGIASGDGEVYETRFDRLERLILDGLPSIEHFSSGSCNLYFPSLLGVTIIACPELKNFTEGVSDAPKLSKVHTGRHKDEWEWDGSLDKTIHALYVEKHAEEKAAQNMSRGQIE